MSPIHRPFGGTIVASWCPGGTSLLFPFHTGVHFRGQMSSAPGGQLLLGGVDSSLFEGDIAYSPLVANSSLSTEYPTNWKSTIQGMAANGNALPNSRFDAIFDSGTSRKSQNKIDRKSRPEQAEVEDFCSSSSFLYNLPTLLLLSLRLS